MKKICVIGAGPWGKNHINTLNKLDALGGLVEIQSDIRNNIKTEYPHVKVYSDIKDALLDAFAGYIVVTPAKTHFKIAKLIIESGKPVLIEKPMTLSIHEARQLVDLSNRYQVNVMVGHLLLFHPAVKEIKKMIDSGVIGELQYLYSNRLNLGKVRMEENVFWSLAPHDVAIFQHLINLFPNKIHSTGSTFLQKGIHDSTLTHLKYENGIEGHIFVSWLHPFKEHRLVVIGSEAMITFEDSLNEKPLKLYSKRIDLRKEIPEKIDGPVKIINYKKESPLENQLKYFIENLSEKTVPIANVEHGYDVVKTLVRASEQLLK